MAFNVQDFRTSMQFDGARPNLFEVELSFPSAAPNGIAASASRFMVKSAQLPGSTIGIAPVYYFGREIKFPGNRTFADWTVTIINDEDFVIRNAMETWMNAINSHAGNVRNAVNHTTYSANGLVKQFGKKTASTNPVPIKAYSFIGMFPVDVAPIDLDWGSNDSIEEYTVTFAYQWWESVSQTDGVATQVAVPLN
jgi:hypothetical protein